MKTLVLDLDETLVHSTFEEIENPDLIIPMAIEDEIYDVHVLVRPGAVEFLEELSKLYEIVIFTASLSKYADPLITKLDINKRCSHRLFREHCTYLDGAYIKDMSKMGRNLRNIIIVDNSPISYSLQQPNGIPIKSWYDDKDDRDLFRFLPILKNLSGFYDVRTEIPKFVTGNTLIWAKAIRWVEENYIIINEGKSISKVDNYIRPKSNQTQQNQNNHIQINQNPVTNSNIKEYNFKPNTAQRYNDILNQQPKININIINGSYNKIVLTEGDEVPKYNNNFLKDNHIRNNTQTNSPDKSPTQNIIANLKNNINATNKLHSIHTHNNSNKFSLNYNLFNKGRNNINIVENNSNISMVNVNETESKEDELFKTQETQILTVLNKSNNLENDNDKHDDEKIMKSTLKKNNYFDIYKIKTNFSTFLKNHKNFAKNNINFNKHLEKNSSSNNLNANKTQVAVSGMMKNSNTSIKNEYNSTFTTHLTKKSNIYSDISNSPALNYLKTRNSNKYGKDNSNVINNLETNSNIIENLYKKLFNQTPTIKLNDRLHSSKSGDRNKNNLTNSLNLKKNQPFNLYKHSLMLRNSHNLSSKNDSKLNEEYVYIKTESDTCTTGSNNYLDTNSSAIIHKTQCSSKCKSKIPSKIKQNINSSKVNKYLSLKFPLQAYINNTRKNILNKK